MDIDKRRRFIINFIYFFIIAAIIYVVLKYGISLIAPFLFAFIVAFILKRPIAFFSRKLHMKRTFAAILLVILFYVSLGAIISFIGVRIFIAARDFIFALPGLYTGEIQPFLVRLFENIESYAKKIDPALISILDDFSSDLLQSLGNLISSFSVNIVTAVSSYASSLPVFLVKLLFAFISTFFITIDYDNVVAFLLRQLPEKKRDLVLTAKDHLFHTLGGYGRSYALIMGITFIELSAGLTIIGVENSVYIALLISVVDILPVLGTGGVMIPWAIYSFLQANAAFAVKLIVVYVVITIIRNIIEPKIVGTHVGLPPLVTLLAMFVGTRLFGVIGLFGLPITLSLLKNMNDQGVIHIFK